MRLFWLIVFTAITTAATADVPVCYSRDYDARHLAKHPHQTVTSFEFAFKQRSSEYQMWLTRRGKRTLYYNAGRCDPGQVNGKAGVYCHAQMDCDGDCGSFGVILEGNESLLAHFRVSKGSFSLHSEEGHDILVPDLDDGVFRLYKEPSSACAFNPEYWTRVSSAPSNVTDRIPLSQGFRSPSGNIMCSSSLQDEAPQAVLNCEISELENLPPKKPAWCEYDWGQAFIVTSDADAGERMCHSDSIYNDGYQTLPYGTVWRSNGFECLSEKSGLRCWNGNGHGFFLSRARQELF